MKQRELVPKRRFAEFVEEWNTNKIRELASFSKGKGYSRKDLVSYGNPIILYGHLYTDYQSYIQTVKTYAIKKDSSVISQGNEVIVPSSGETAEDIARASAVGKPGIILGGDLNIIKPNPRVDALFLGLSISNSNLKKELIKRVQGSSVVHLYNSDIEELKLNYPILKEQQKIGKYFKHLDEMIALQQRKIDKTKALKSAYLAEMFPSEGERTPKRRFTGFTNEWKEQTLNMVADYRNGKAHEQSVVNDGNYIIVNSKFVSTNGYTKKYSNRQIEPLIKGEIAFVLSDVPNGRAVARTYLIQTNNKFTLNQRIAGITPKENTDSYFLKELMNRHKYFLNFDDGVNQTNISNDDLESFEVYYPDFKEQQKIGEFFKHLDDIITTHEQKLEKLKAIKQAYLHEMFV